jgi:high-affinity nickel-transport protein
VGVLGVTATQGAFHVGLLVTAFALGVRHGIDWDHIAALTDITGSQHDARRSMSLATLYALGHAVMVLALGLAAILLAARLPSSVDGVMEHVVGVTLIALAGYVLYGLLRHGRAFRMRSRWMLAIGIFGRLRHRASRTGEVVVIEHEHPLDGSRDHSHRDGVAAAPSSLRVRRGQRHQHRGVMPPDPFVEYGRRSAFLVGVLHGIGTETPTQVLVLAAAAGAGGSVAGVSLLACFVLGLVASNSALAAAGTLGFLGASRRGTVYFGVSITTAAFSLVVGTVFLLGRTSALPAFFGG